MDRYKETFETWNKLANLYQDKFMDLNLYNETYDFFCQLLPKENSKVLEIACGPGNITKYLLNKKPALELLATDVSPKMIELAKKNNPLANFAILDCRHINQIKTKFDAVVSGFCVPYLSETDCEKFIFDSVSLLNLNGLLYLSFVEGDTKQSGFVKGSTGDRAYFYYHNLNSLLSNFAKHNFELLKTFYVDYQRSNNVAETHTILILKKL